MKKKKRKIECICEQTDGNGLYWLIGNQNCPIHYPKFVKRFCEYCGKKCIEIPREHEFSEATGKQLMWLICPKRTIEYNKKLGNNRLVDEEQEKHSRWVKELVS